MALVVPELCYLMNLHQEFPELSIKAAVELMVAPMSCDSGTQTPTHFVEKFIDVNYNWNEWALRRCAPALVHACHLQCRPCRLCNVQSTCMQLFRPTCWPLTQMYPRMI